MDIQRYPDPISCARSYCEELGLPAGIPAKVIAAEYLGSLPNLHVMRDADVSQVYLALAPDNHNVLLFPKGSTEEENLQAVLSVAGQALYLPNAGSHLLIGSSSPWGQSFAETLNAAEEKPLKTPVDYLEW